MLNAETFEDSCSYNDMLYFVQLSVMAVVLNVSVLFNIFAAHAVEWATNNILVNKTLYKLLHCTSIYLFT